MNVVLPKKEKMSTKAMVLYIFSIIICVVAAIIVAFSQYYGPEELDKMIAVSTDKEVQQQIAEEELKAGFDDIFTNRIENYQLSVDVNKLDNSKEIVYPYYEKHEKQDNNYDLDITIPIINIDNDIVRQYNNAISRDFVEKAESVLETKNKNTIYTVQYIATVNDDILSLMIRSNLKDGSSAQRVIIQTYHFDLKNNKEATLEEMLNKKELQVSVVENKVRKEIEREQKKVEDLKALGYNIFERNVNDEIYKIENTDQFFVKDGNIYLIYAYGNTALTSEMDLIIV